MRLRLVMCAALAFGSISCFKDPPATEMPPVQISTRIVTDKLTYPWEIMWGPDDKIWLTERGGTISRLDPTTGDISELLVIDEVESRGEGGLLGMVMADNTGNQPLLFVAYNYLKGGNYILKIVRYTYENDQLASPLLILDDVAGGNIHDGCRMVISSDDKLFITTGDASDETLPQRLDAVNGKVLRLNLNGTIPADNPIAGSPVWSLGHRNAQGLVFVNDSLFSSEHGPDTDDEVNIIHKGGNYGWPNVKGDCDADEQEFCDANQVIEPIMKWTPTIAVCGLEYYNNDHLPQWKNSLLMCTLKASKLVQLRLSEDGRTISASNDFFNGQFGRLRDICISPAGKVYLCTSNGNDDKVIEVSASN